MSKIRIRGDGWKCGSCRFFKERSGIAYHGVCLENNERQVMKEDWCDDFEKKESKAKGGHLRGLFEDRGQAERPDKTGGDR